MHVNVLLVYVLQICKVHVHIRFVFKYVHEIIYVHTNLASFLLTLRVFFESVYVYLNQFSPIKRRPFKPRLKNLGSILFDVKYFTNFLLFGWAETV